MAGPDFLQKYTSFISEHFSPGFWTETWCPFTGLRAHTHMNSNQKQDDPNNHPKTVHVCNGQRAWPAIPGPKKIDDAQGNWLNVIYLDPPVNIGAPPQERIVSLRHPAYLVHRLCVYICLGEGFFASTPWNALLVIKIITSYDLSSFHWFELHDAPHLGECSFRSSRSKYFRHTSLRFKHSDNVLFRQWFDSFFRGNFPTIFRVMVTV